MTMLDLSRKHDRAAELRAIADGRLMLNVRNGVTVARSMLARIADEFEAMSTALAAKDAELASVKMSASAWEDSARINKDRAERAEAELGAVKAERDEARRRRDEWRKKAEGYDEVRRALREKIGATWPPNMSRALWAGIAADEKKRADDAEAQLAEARKALEWHPIETAPLNTIVDLWCTYADAPASWGNDRPAGQIVHNRHKSKEHGWFGNESNDGIPQANGPDLVPVAWRWPAPEIPLEMMERFVAARRAREHGGENV